MKNQQQPTTTTANNQDAHAFWWANPFSNNFWDKVLAVGPNEGYAGMGGQQQQQQYAAVVAAAAQAQAQVDEDAAHRDDFIARTTDELISEFAEKRTHRDLGPNDFDSSFPDEDGGYVYRYPTGLVTPVAYPGVVRDAKAHWERDVEAPALAKNKYYHTLWEVVTPKLPGHRWFVESSTRPFEVYSFLTREVANAHCQFCNTIDGWGGVALGINGSISATSWASRNVTTMVSLEYANNVRAKMVISGHRSLSLLGRFVLRSIGAELTIPEDQTIKALAQSYAKGVFNKFWHGDLGVRPYGKPTHMGAAAH